MWSASVIVRARDEEAAIGRALESLRRQTVRPQIIVVDSGSRDRTLEIARPLADEIIEMPPERFSYGRALNVGAEAAQAPVHFALSAHCAAEREDWIERSLGHYADPLVAGTNGHEADGLHVQDLAHARANPYVGFSNHASSWRADVWRAHPFDERLEACEDKDWGLRVLEAGWKLVFDPALTVDRSHTWRAGARSYYARQRKEWRTLAGLHQLPPYGARELARDWWTEELRPGLAGRVRRRLSPLRAAGLAGKWAGLRGTR